MSETQILIQFKNSLVSFIDELIEAFPQEPDLIILRIFLKDQVPVQDVMNKFIHTIKMINKLKKILNKEMKLFFLKMIFLKLFQNLNQLIFQNYGDLIL